MPDVKPGSTVEFGESVQFARCVKSRDDWKVKAEEWKKTARQAQAELLLVSSALARVLASDYDEGDVPDVEGEDHSERHCRL